MSAWVLLRGWARESRHWGDFPALLATRAHAQVIALDLPGNGTRCRERSPADVRAMVQAARDVLATRSVRGPVHLLGMSLGAMVAMTWASRHPDELASAVLVNGSGRDLGAPWERLRPGVWPALLRAACTQGRAREAAIFSACSNFGPRDLADRWATYAADSPTSAANALRQIVAAIRFRRPPARPRVPMLVLASGHDKLVSPACSVRLAADWKLPIRMHATAGHDLGVDDPVWLAAACAEWAQDCAVIEVTPNGHEAVMRRFDTG